MNIAKIDGAILAAASNNWQKVAMIIAKVAPANADAFADEEDDFQLTAERIEALIAEGRLVAEGDVSNWRRSEVKLP